MGTDAGTAPTIDADVAIVGGGPAGCSAGVFTARAGLDTLVFDRGTSSIARCAYLEDYLGFPAGIDVGTFHDLMHAHAARAGCEVVADLVETVVRIDGDGFRVETQDGRTVEARAIVAATKYDAGYLRGLNEGMFDDDAEDTYAQSFVSERVDQDGRTPIDGLYVAGPLAGAGDQAIIAAGHGAQVARSLAADVRLNRGYWDDVATRYDWVRRESERTGEWRDRETWVAYVDEHRTPDDLGLGDEERERIREEVIDRRLSTYVTSEEVERRTARGQRALAGELDPAHLLSAIDDDIVRAYLTDGTKTNRQR